MAVGEWRRSSRAGDALSARAGVDILQDLGLPVLALSGLLSPSPLAAREALRDRAAGADRRRAGRRG
jgi:hypothetical protein